MKEITGAAFARWVVVVAFCAVSGAGLSGCSDNEASSPPQERTVAPPSGDDVKADDGSLTVGTTEGPYYLSGTAELEDGNLNAARLPGEPIRVSGRVFGGEGSERPLEGAKVEIWHADAAGAYHPAAGGAASDFSASDLKLRGYVLTDADGAYEFTSIYPGYYPGRTRHIHVRVSAEGYGAVATQIIVPAKPGDGTTPDTDAIARSLPASYQVEFAENGGVLETTFDFRLGGD